MLRRVLYGVGFGIAALVAPGGGVAAAGECDGTGKVEICHAPPAHPENARTLRVSCSAWPPHELHGDSFGACAEDRRCERFGTTELFARVPAEPGYPEGIAVDRGVVYVGVPSRLDRPTSGPELVHAFDARSGAPRTDFPVTPDPGQPRSLTGMAVDAQGRLYVAEVRGIVRIDPLSGAEELYAGPFANLPSCDAAPPGSDCSPVPFVDDREPLLNDIGFDDDGHLYVTDSAQATIWRVPPGASAGPRAPEIWFQDARIHSANGANGIQVHPDAPLVYFAETIGGVIYTLPLVDAPGAGDLAVFHAFDPLVTGPHGPDGLVFGESGRLYVTLAGANQVAVLEPDGELAALFPDALSNLQQPVPYDSPASIDFHPQRGSLLVVNHALFSNNPSSFAVLEACVQDDPGRIPRPEVP